MKALVIFLGLFSICTMAEAKDDSFNTYRDIKVGDSASYVNEMGVSFVRTITAVSDDEEGTISFEDKYENGMENAQTVKINGGDAINVGPIIINEYAVADAIARCETGFKGKLTTVTLKTGPVTGCALHLQFGNSRRVLIDMIVAPVMFGVYKKVDNLELIGVTNSIEFKE